MYPTALLIIAIFICLIFHTRDRSRTFKPFDLDATLPLRGLLAVLIVCHHLGQKEAGHIPIAGTIFASLGMLIVAVFFMISGYGLFHSYKRKGMKYLDGFLGKRYAKILPVFVILSILCVGLSIYEGASASQLLAQYKRGTTPLPASWFIYAIIYIYAAFYLSAKIGKSLMKTGLIFTGFICIYIGVTRYVLNFEPFWYLSILCTSAGYYIGYYEKEIENVAYRHKTMFFAGVICALVLSYIAFCNLPYATEWCMLWLIVNVLAVYVIVRALGMVRWRFLVWVGAFSLEVYLVHGIFIKYVFLRPGLPTGIVLYAEVITSAIIAAWLLHKLTNYVVKLSR